MNVLIYAFRADTPRHEVAHAWLTSCLEDLAEEVVIPDLVWVGFARITTHPRIFREPSTVDEVAGFARGDCDADRAVYSWFELWRGVSVPVDEGCPSAWQPGDRRRQAIADALGSVHDAYPEGYLEQLREDWPE